MHNTNNCTARSAACLTRRKLYRWKTIIYELDAPRFRLNLTSENIISSVSSQAQSASRFVKSPFSAIRSPFVHLENMEKKLRISCAAEVNYRCCASIATECTRYSKYTVNFSTTKLKCNQLFHALTKLYEDSITRSEMRMLFRKYLELSHREAV